jgi:hypothetical protein
MNEYIWLTLEGEEYMLYVPSLRSCALRYDEWLRDHNDIPGLLALHRGEYEHLRSVLAEHPLRIPLHDMYLAVKLEPQTMKWGRAKVFLDGWLARPLNGPIKEAKLNSECTLAGEPSGNFIASYNTVR